MDTARQAPTGIRLDKEVCIMQSILQVKDLVKRYRAFTLDHVSFSLPKGSILGLIGENGAGKTTTLKLILNLIRKEGGTVSLFGMDPVRQERQVKEQIGVVLDESYFHDTLTPKDVAAGLRRIYPGWDDGLFERYLRRFSLPKGQAIKEFSRGMKKKLSIASALGHRPRLLILDEATSGLDPVVRSEILDVFLDFIQDEEHSILLSSHITSDLEKIADYLVFLHKGRVVFEEPKDDLLQRYGVLRCGEDVFARLERSQRVGYRRSRFGYEVLVRDRAALRRRFPSAVVDAATIEDIMLFYVRGEQQ